MLNHQAFLRCSQTTATFLFILIGTLFILTGCSQFYKFIGLTDQQTADQVNADQAVRQFLVKQARDTTTEIISLIIAGTGALLTGLLAKWLNTEKKITKALITGIEKAPNDNVKQSVQSQAISAGIEAKLHARVKSFT